MAEPDMGTDLLDLDAIEARAKAATPGPLFNSRYHSDMQGQHLEDMDERLVAVLALRDDEEANAAFFGQAREDVLALVKALRAERVVHTKTKAERDRYFRDIEEALAVRMQANRELEFLKGQCVLKELHDHALHDLDGARAGAAAEHTARVAAEADRDALRRVVLHSHRHALLQFARERRGPLEPNETISEVWLETLDPVMWEHAALRKDEAAALRAAGLGVRTRTTEGKEQS
jgi:hypothetical protein